MRFCEYDVADVCMIADGLPDVKSIRIGGIIYCKNKSGRCCIYESACGRDKERNRKNNTEKRRRAIERGLPESACGKRRGDFGIRTGSAGFGEGGGGSAARIRDGYEQRERKAPSYQQRGNG